MLVQYMSLADESASQRIRLQKRNLTVGRPKQFDRDEAITAVLNEMWEHGYEACSANSLAGELGITRSSFYNAFGSREDLFREVLDIYNGPTPDRGWFAISNSGSVLQAITKGVRNVCKARFRDRSRRGCLVMNSISELVGRNEKLGPVVEQVFNANVEYLEYVLNIAAERGEIEKRELRVKALALQNVLTGLNVMSKVIRDEDELWAATEHSLRALGLYRA